MGILGAAAALLPSKLPSPEEINPSSYIHKTTRSRSTTTKNNKSTFPVARLFGPATFEASKLKVVYLEEKPPSPELLLPRTYTLTHCDITSNLLLAISQTINTSQFEGWYNRLQRDEVVAVWKKIKGKMSLHVHCHVSGGHFLLDFLANLRYYIFSKELPVVLKAFVHGDEELFSNYPELQEEALAWVYFHSNIPEFNKVECWGPINVALDGPLLGRRRDVVPPFETPCQHTCSCCSASNTLLFDFEECI